MSVGSGTPVVEAADGSIGRGAVVGSIVGYVVVFTIVGTIGLVNSAGLLPSFVLGLFAGFWGGPGFGGMLGATLAATRAEKLKATAARTSSTATRAEPPEPEQAQVHDPAA